MTEVEKLYSLAGVEKHPKIMLDEDTGAVVRSLNEYYPPFTAEKQIEIVKFLLKKSVYYDTDGDREYWFHLSDEIENSKYREFDEALVECISKMWNDLRDYEQEQIREILK